MHCRKSLCRPVKRPSLILTLIYVRIDKETSVRFGEIEQPKGTSVNREVKILKLRFFATLIVKKMPNEVIAHFVRVRG